MKMEQRWSVLAGLVGGVVFALGYTLLGPVIFGYHSSLALGVVVFVAWSGGWFVMHGIASRRLRKRSQ
jgi:hypothetical protein